jgi:hypothetical protein
MWAPSSNPFWGCQRAELVEHELLALVHPHRLERDLDHDPVAVLPEVDRLAPGEIEHGAGDGGLGGTPLSVEHGDDRGIDRGRGIAQMIGHVAHHALALTQAPHEPDDDDRPEDRRETEGDGGEDPAAELGLVVEPAEGRLRRCVRLVPSRLLGGERSGRRDRRRRHRREPRLGERDIERVARLPDGCLGRERDRRSLDRDRAVPAAVKMRVDRSWCPFREHQRPGQVDVGVLA